MDLRPTAVMLIDLDNFKSINDRFGHAVGDRVLQIFAETREGQCPSDGLVGRWGGDEFVAVLYDTGPRGGASLGERIQAPSRRRRPNIDGQLVNATLSASAWCSARTVRSTCRRCWRRPTRRSIWPRSWGATASRSRRPETCGSRSRERRQRADPASGREQVGRLKSGHATPQSRCGERSFSS